MLLITNFFSLFSYMIQGTYTKGVSHPSIDGQKGITINMLNDGKDYYYDLYKEAKLTNDQLRQFAQFQNLSDDEAEKLSDMIFDLAIVAQKIITETNE